MLSHQVVPAIEKHTATFFFLHGLGDSGHSWMDLGRYLSRKLGYFKFVFPNAPAMPVTINGGYKMPAWYDILHMDIGAEVEEKTNRSHIVEDIAGMERTRKSLMELVKSEVDNGIAPSRIAIGGFSQGGAITLYTLTASNTDGIQFGAAVALSSYLPDHQHVEGRPLAQTVTETPVLMAHGTSDQVVKYVYGKDSFELLKRKGFKSLEFKSYPGMAHSACEEEFVDIGDFLFKSIPPQ